VARPRADLRAPWCVRDSQAPSRPAVDPFALGGISRTRKRGSPAGASESRSRGERGGAPLATQPNGLESHIQRRSRRLNCGRFDRRRSRASLSPERQVLEREVAAGSERRAQGAQQSEYEALASWLALVRQGRRPVPRGSRHPRRRVTAVPPRIKGEHGQRRASHRARERRAR
jgi:hypothetical protein